MKYLSTKEAAARLGVHVASVRKMIAAGRLKSKLIGRDRFVTEKDLRLVLAQPSRGWPRGKPRNSKAVTNEDAS